MSVDTYTYGGYYLKCKPKVIKVESEIEACMNGHEKQRRKDGDFCGRCGEKFHTKPSVEHHNCSFYDLDDRWREDFMTDEDADMLMQMFDTVPGERHNNTEFLIFNDWRTVSLNDWQEECNLEHILENGTPDEIFEALEIDGVIKLLTDHLYEEVFFGFGIVQGWG